MNFHYWYSSHIVVISTHTCCVYIHPQTTRSRAHIYIHTLDLTHIYICTRSHTYALDLTHTHSHTYTACVSCNRLPAKLVATSTTPPLHAPNSTPTTRRWFPIRLNRLKWSTTLSRTIGCTTTCLGTFTGMAGTLENTHNTLIFSTMTQCYNIQTFNTKTTSHAVAESKKITKFFRIIRAASGRCQWGKLSWKISWTLARTS